MRNSDTIEKRACKALTLRTAAAFSLLGGLFDELLSTALLEGISRVLFEGLLGVVELI